MGLGGFYMPGTGPFDSQTIPLENAFAVPLTPRTRDNTFDINLYKMGAIRIALQTWRSRWKSSTVLVFTDSKTSELGLLKQTLRSPANAPLRQALLLAAIYDITLEPTWIEGSTNILADALSRFDNVTIANLCPHWQNYSTSILLRYFTPGQPA